MGKKTIELIAHRGAGHAEGLTIENTLLAFEYAGQLGAKAIEFDVKISSDGKCLVFHDETLERFFPNDTRCFSACAFAQLEVLRFKNAAHIPTVEEVLDIAQKYRMTVHLEIKDSECAIPISEILTHYTDSEIVISAADGNVLQQLRATGRPLALLYPYYKAFPSVERVTQDIAQFGISAIHVAADKIPNNEWATAVRVAGVTILRVYTVNKVGDLTRLFEHPIDAVFTDRIDLLQTV